MNSMDTLLEKVDQTEAMRMGVVFSADVPANIGGNHGAGYWTTLDSGFAVRRSAASSSGRRG